MLVPCMHFASAAVCATLAAGWIRGAGEGFDVSRASEQPWGSLGVRMSWEPWSFGAFALRVHAEADIPVTTNQFLVDRMSVWTGPSIERRFGIALLVHFP